MEFPPCVFFCLKKMPLASILIIRNRTWDGVTAPYCNTCGLYLGSPIRSVEAVHNARKLFLRTAGLLAGLAAIAVLILAICGPDK